MCLIVGVCYWSTRDPNTTYLSGEAEDAWLASRRHTLIIFRVPVSSCEIPYTTAQTTLSESCGSTCKSGPNTSATVDIQTNLVLYLSPEGLQIQRQTSLFSLDKAPRSRFSRFVSHDASCRPRTLQLYKVETSELLYVSRRRWTIISHVTDRPGAQRSVRV